MPYPQPQPQPHPRSQPVPSRRLLDDDNQLAASVSGAQRGTLLKLIALLHTQGEDWDSWLDLKHVQPRDNPRTASPNLKNVLPSP